MTSTDDALFVYNDKRCSRLIKTTPTERINT